MRGVSVFEVRGGKISRYKEFYDGATIMRQVEVLPAEKEWAAPPNNGMHPTADTLPLM